METRGIIEASSHLATVWLIDVVANKFGVIGWRVYRHVAADFSPLGSPSSVRAQFLWKLIGSKISRTVSRDRVETGYVSNAAPILPFPSTPLFRIFRKIHPTDFRCKPSHFPSFIPLLITTNYPHETRESHEILYLNLIDIDYFSSMIHHSDFRRERTNR